MPRSIAIPALCFLSLTMLAPAAPAAPGPKPRPIIDRRETGHDFALQGEYVSELPDGRRYGVQVIALGDDRFRAVGYWGGLPGDGWDGTMPETCEASSTGERIEFRTERGKGLIDLTLCRAAGGLLDSAGKWHAALTRVVRQSPTLGLAPPEGAIVLFDGKGGDRESVRAWRGGRAKEGLLQVGTQTVESFDDFQLHVEFMTPYMPYARGQDRGNSGVYLQRRYEIQILDSFGLEGADNECGAIYGFRRPDVNMCFPPLSWQTFDVDFRMARFDDTGQKTENACITVRHNGVLIHDAVELTKSGDDSWKTAETPAGGPLLLQFHGAPVQFQNIWLVPRAAR
jgi:hypothetical protein